MLPKSQNLCSGTLQWPRESCIGYVCQDCGRAFERGELQGRDDHMPPHEPMAAQSVMVAA